MDVFTHFLLMGPSQKPLDILKNAHSKLKKSTQKHRKALLDLLSKKEKLSDADENWLDTDGNLVDEQRVIEELETASDFKQGAQIMEKLHWAAAGLERVSQKRKCMHSKSNYQNSLLIQCLFDRCQQPRH